MRTFRPVSTVLSFSVLVSVLVAAWILTWTAPVSADESQDKLVQLLKDRSQVDFLIGQRIEADKLPLQPWQNDRPGEQAWGPPAAQPLFDGGGSLYLVHLFGTWCAPCKQELPLLAQAWAELQKDAEIQKSVRLLFVAVEGNPADPIRAWQRDVPSLGMGTVLPLFGDAGSKLPEALGDQTAYGAPGYPATLLVDRCGVIRHAFLGPLIGRRAVFDMAVRRLASATAGLTCPSDRTAQRKPARKFAKAGPASTRKQTR
ncbi:MAG TPA: TlpA disulfide reductase family protein [Pseudomonadota bacterium]|nr:TlpA disulfide reductase family protein [Pseudomonadota bacterium]